MKDFQNASVSRGTTNGDPTDSDPDEARDLICFSHLRWDHVFQRPQQLMERFSRNHRVLFVEEPIPVAHHLPYLEFHAFEGAAVTAVRPRIPEGSPPEETQRILAGLLDELISLLRVRDPILWFYTPMMWPAAAHLDRSAVVYDCMDELFSFRFAPPGLAGAEGISSAPAPAWRNRWTRRRSPVRESASRA